MSKRSTARNNKEREALSSIVNLDGSGEDPAVKAMLSDQFVKGSNAEALDIATALQQIIRGQSLLESRFSEELSKVTERMNEMDKAAARWETDREKFVQEVLDRADKVRATGFEKDKIQAAGAQQFTEAISKARAEHATEQIKFEDELRRMPKVRVVSAGELVMVNEGGRQVAKIMNETVKIKTHKWTLPAGVAVEVPLVVAQVLEQRRRLQDETAAREKLLSANPESSKLTEQWKEINTKYNSTTDTLPSVT